MTDRPAYPSDLSDARWALIAPRLTAWRQARTDAGVGGRTASHDLREIFNAILYVNRTGIARTRAGRSTPPSAGVIDSQSVKTSTNAPLSTQGIDAGKKIVGRKRGIVTDTLGLLLAVIVTAASVSDNIVGMDLLEKATAVHPA